jgi:hypothetical protein
MEIKPQSVLQGMAGAILFLAIVAGAQTPAPAPSSTTAPDSTTAAPAAPAAAAPAAAPVWSVGTVDFSGYVDAYYSYNENRPGNYGAFGQVNDLYNFDDATDQFNLEAAKLTLNHDPDPVGAHLDIIFGRTNSLIHCGSCDQTLNYIEQAYISVKPPKAKGFELDAGQFVTSAGDEVIETMSNWSYSHGLLFSYAIPYYHFGVRTSLPVNKVWTIGAQVVNGWNDVANNNGGVTGGFTSALVKPKYTWNLNYYVGPEPESAGKGMTLYGTTGDPTNQKVIRNLIDTTFLLTPNAKFNAYINYDYGQNKNSAYSYSYPNGEGNTIVKVPEISQHWQGIAVSGRGQVTPNAALVVRYEYFYDQGTQTLYVNPKTNLIAPQTLDEITATYEYKWVEGLLMRVEYRRDWSDKAYFQKGTYETNTSQDTATVGLIAFFGPKR